MLEFFGEQAFRLRANAPRGKRGLRCKRGNRSANLGRLRNLEKLGSALPTFILKLTTLLKLPKFPNKAPTALPPPKIYGGWEIL